MILRCIWIISSQSNNWWNGEPLSSICWDLIYNRTVRSNRTDRSSRCSWFQVETSYSQNAEFSFNCPHEYLVSIPSCGFIPVLPVPHGCLSAVRMVFSWRRGGRAPPIALRRGMIDLKKWGPWSFENRRAFIIHLAIRGTIEDIKWHAFSTQGNKLILPRRRCDLIRNQLVRGLES